MKVIFEARSTNGRWGMAIVGPDGTKLPAQGSLSNIGTVAGLPENHHFINAERITKMRRGTYLINTARGELVDTVAMLAALKSGQLAGAGLDVLEEERSLKAGADTTLSAEASQHVAANKELMQMPNVVITPHVAFDSREASKDIQEISAGNIVAFLEGKPTNVV